MESNEFPNKRKEREENVSLDYFIMRKRNYKIVELLLVNFVHLKKNNID